MAVRVKPRRLAPGDAVAVVAPAGRFAPEELRAGVAVLEERGLRVVLDDGIFSSHFFLAGDDERRSGEINRAFADPAIRAIFCARGGTGSSRALARLDWAVVRANPKILVGYSDLTVLLAAVTQRTGLVTFHGPVVSVDFGRMRDTVSIDHLFRLLASPAAFGEIAAPDHGLRCLKPGRARGPLIGGCLSLVVTTLGTPYEIDTAGSILFLEDVGEPAYRIDRMMTHLRHAGKLDSVAGIVFGTMHECMKGGRDGPYGTDEILTHALEGIEVPVLAGFPSGHGPRNLALPFGIAASLDAQAPSLRLEEGAVE